MYHQLVIKLRFISVSGSATVQTRLVIQKVV
jgi:hypothetical protein